VVASLVDLTIVNNVVGGGALAWIRTAGEGNLLQRRRAFLPEQCAVYRPCLTARYDAVADACDASTIARKVGEPCLSRAYSQKLSP